MPSLAPQLLTLLGALLQVCWWGALCFSATKTRHILFRPALAGGALVLLTAVQQSNVLLLVGQVLLLIMLVGNRK